MPGFQGKKSSISLSKTPSSSQGSESALKKVCTLYLLPGIYLSFLLSSWTVSRRINQPIRLRVLVLRILERQTPSIA